MTGRLTASVATLAAVAAVLACAPEADQFPSQDPLPPADETEAKLPAGLTDPTRPPDPGLLLPPMDDYITDDRAEPGELEASLDDGSVPYVEVRRRLILDESEFTAGEVTVVTVPPEPGAAERVLDHRFGAAPRTPVQVAGVELLRIDADPVPVLARVGPTYVVTFARGADRSDAWLDNLARATLRAIMATRENRG